MATDTKYCYISTTTSQSGSSSNYQNIPYRMPTTTPVIYQGSDVDPLYYMPIAIWSNVPVFKNTVYYNNGTNTVTYPTSYGGLLSMNQDSGPAMYGNGAGSSDTALGFKATPFFGRYREHYGMERSNWQVYTGYAGGDDATADNRFPPAAPIKVSANYEDTVQDAIYNGDITVTLYNYAEYSATACIHLLAGSASKYSSDYLTAGAMVVSSSKLSPGTCTFNIELSDDSEVRSITSIEVYWYSQSGEILISYAYPVSFTIGDGGVGCGCTALILSTGACTCAAKALSIDTCVCGAQGGSMITCTCAGVNGSIVVCSCGGEHSKVTVCSSGNAQIPSCSSASTQITVSPV